MEQLASKTMETDSFNLKPPKTNVSTSLSQFSSFLHHSTTIYVISHHEFYHVRGKSQTGRKLGESLRKHSKLANFPPMRSAIFLCVALFPRYFWKAC